jgi:hypothetical protein
VFDIGQIGNVCQFEHKKGRLRSLERPASHTVLFLRHNRPNLNTSLPKKQTARLLTPGGPKQGQMDALTPQFYRDAASNAKLLSVMPDHLCPSIFARSALGLLTYQWQNDVLAAVGKRYPTALCAVNGSGKSSTVISALLIWFMSEYPAGRCVITSGSWSQLKAQVFDSARRFSELPICRGWEFLDASIKTPQGGFVLGISVDEAFRAEGYHQRDGSPVLLIVDEAKAVADPVFESFGKCTPTLKLVTSSAGPASGRFYRYFSSESAYWFRRKHCAM